MRVNTEFRLNYLVYFFAIQMLNVRYSIALYLKWPEEISILNLLNSLFFFSFCIHSYFNLIVGILYFLFHSFVFINIG